MAKKIQGDVQNVRLILDPSDASRDQFITPARAKKLYNLGRIFWDVTNGCYCTDKKLADSES